MPSHFNIADVKIPFVLIIHAMIQSMKIQWKPVWIITYNYYNRTPIYSLFMSPVSPLKNGFPSFGDIELDNKSGLPFKLSLFYVAVFWWPSGIIHHTLLFLFQLLGHLPEYCEHRPLWMRRSKYHFLLCHPAMTSQQCGWTGLLDK